MQVQLVPLKSLAPYLNNSRTHGPLQIDAIAASIDEFGMAGSIVARNNIIAKGHGTLLAIAQLYKKGLQVYPLPGKANGAEPFPPGMVPMLDATGWTEAQFKAFVIADNQLALSAGWNDALLRIEIGSLKAEAFDTDLLGFSDKFLSHLFTNTDEQKAAAANNIPNLPAIVTTQRGDIWVLGPHRIMCGDSTSPGDLAALMLEQKVALVHADPPYGMGKAKDGVQNDNLYAEKLDAFQMAWWNACRPHVTDNGSAYIWGNAFDLWRLWFAGGLGNSERLELRNELVWDKKSIAGMKSDGLTQYPEASERCLFFQIGKQFLGNVNTEDYPEEYEPIRAYLAEQAAAVELTPKDVKRICGTGMYSHWFTKSQFHFIGQKHYNKLVAAYPGFFLRDWMDLKREWDRIKGVKAGIIGKKLSGVRSYFDNGHAIMRDVWEFERVVGDERFGHATPKPVAMMERIMLSTLPAGGACIEPFIGTGSTLIGAEATGRVCYGLELTPGYVDTTVTRWQNYTGQQAVLEATGETFEQVRKARLV